MHYYHYIKYRFNKVLDVIYNICLVNCQENIDAIYIIWDYKMRLVGMVLFRLY